MAADIPPYLVILDARIENERLRGPCEYIEPRPEGLRLRWSVESQPEDFAPGASLVSIQAAYFSQEEADDPCGPQKLRATRFWAHVTSLHCDRLKSGASYFVVWERR